MSKYFDSRFKGNPTGPNIGHVAISPRRPGCIAFIDDMPFEDYKRLMDTIDVIVENALTEDRERVKAVVKQALDIN